jgi:cell wall-associated NlpC family hydrolase
MSTQAECIEKMEMMRQFNDIMVPQLIRREREAVVDEAASWKGTPFHHHAAVKGSGVDCAHLAAAVYEHAGVLEDGKIGYYGQDWYMHEDAERLLDRVSQFCVEVVNPQSGDLVLFAFGRASAHVGIVTSWPEIIHADRTLAEVVTYVVEPEGPFARRLTGFWSPKRWHSHHNGD